MEERRNKIYYQVLDGISKHLDSIYVDGGLQQDDVYVAVKDVMRDNPCIFWFSHQWEYSKDEGVLRFYYTINKKRSELIKEQINDVVLHDFRINKVREFSQTEQAMYIYKWLALYCKYNPNSAFNQTICSVFVYRNSVCTGYAKAAQYLFSLLGIQSKLIFGKMNNSEADSRHCWLIVNIDNNWYHFDPTFAVPEISGVLASTGITPFFGHNGLVYNYFCTDTDSLKKSRIIEDEKHLPQCMYKIQINKLQTIPVQLYRGKDDEKYEVGCMMPNQGATAKVFLLLDKTATDGRNNQRVIKTFKENYPSYLQEKELKMSQRVQGEHLLKCYGSVSGHKGIVMEQATTLSDLLFCHYYRLAPRHICKLLVDITKGLIECQKLDVYYTDIHLKNIFRDEYGTYKWGDFGSCTITGDKVDHRKGVGSYWYMAPETYYHDLFDERSSVYGIGMVAYFLLNDFFPPLWYEYGKEALNKRLNGSKIDTPVKLRVNNNFNKELAELIQTCLSFDPTMRIQSLEELVSNIVRLNDKYKNDGHLILEGGTSDRTIDKYEKELDEEERGLLYSINQEGSYNSVQPNFESTSYSSYIYVSNGENDAEIVDCCINNDIYGDYQGDVVCSDCDRIIDDFAYTCGAFDNEANNAPEDFATTMMSFPSDISCSHKDNVSYEPYKPQSSSEPSSSNSSFWGRLFKKNKCSEVCCSVFAPSEVKKKGHLLTQVFLHMQEETGKVANLALEADKNAQRRGYEPLQCRLKKGDKVDVEFTIYNEYKLYSQRKSIIWQGHYTKCSFDYFVPSGIDLFELSGEVLLSVNGALVGELRFLTEIVEEPKVVYARMNVQTFKNIFISYSHEDSQKVKGLALAYKAQGVDYFFDRDKLKAGDVYEEIIFDYIDKADLFILCWSANAAKSDYVEKERHHAMRRAYPQTSLENAKLKICPLSIEPRAALPSDMKDIYNFEDI